MLEGGMRTFSSCFRSPFINYTFLEDLLSCSSIIRCILKFFSRGGGGIDGALCAESIC